MKTAYPTLLLALLLVAAGCDANSEANGDVESDAESAQTSDTKARVILPDGTQRALESAEINISMRAVAVLSEAMSIPISQVTVVSVRPVDWPDSSIGCPQPGQAYAQVITPGHKIAVRARGEIHVLHEAGGKPFLCKRSKPVAELTPKRELAWAGMATKAREDLAGQLGVTPEDIVIRDARRKRFDDASLECPEPGVSYPATPVEGYVIVLTHGRRLFSYHTDLERVVLCPAINAD
ncbi:MAG: hypothetical protein AAFY69_02970 [Pseudomonadota bacterium]